MANQSFHHEQEIARNNAILIYESGGNLIHRFCPEAEATAFLESAALRMNAASMFVSDHHMDSELLFSASPDLRDRVAETKAHLGFQVRVRDALDRHGIERDRDLRNRIMGAIKELRDAGISL